MIRLKMLVGVASLFWAMDLSAQGSWESENKTGFLEECQSHADEVMGASKSTQYCVCMLDKIMTIAQDPVDADMLPKETIEELAYECLDVQDVWDDETLSSFLFSCEEAASSLTDPPLYCNCMAYKLMVMFPDPDDYNLSEKEMEELAKTCFF